MAKRAEEHKPKAGVLVEKKTIRIQKGFGFCVADDINDIALATE